MRVYPETATGREREGAWSWCATRNDFSFHFPPAPLPTPGSGFGMPPPHTKQACHAYNQRASEPREFRVHRPVGRWWPGQPARSPTAAVTRQADYLPWRRTTFPQRQCAAAPSQLVRLSLSLSYGSNRDVSKATGGVPMYIYT
jgi:hypothetical protein